MDEYYCKSISEVKSFADLSISDDSVLEFLEVCQFDPNSIIRFVRQTAAYSKYYEDEIWEHLHDIIDIVEKYYGEDYADTIKYCYQNIEESLIKADFIRNDFNFVTYALSISLLFDFASSIYTDRGYDGQKQTEKYHEIARAFGINDNFKIDDQVYETISPFLERKSYYLFRALQKALSPDQYSILKHAIQRLLETKSIDAALYDYCFTDYELECYKASIYNVIEGPYFQKIVDIVLS